MNKRQSGKKTTTFVSVYWLWENSEKAVLEGRLFLSPHGGRTKLKKKK